MQPIWSPSAQRSQQAHLTRFMHFVQERHKAPVHDYASLHRWSVEFPENFWSALWDFCEVRAERRATQILEDGNRMPGAQWFVGACFNYAENLLRLDGDSPAIICRNERGQRRELSWRQLRQEVARIAAGLRSAGVKEGDRVAGYLPNIPEAVIAMLATASVGAIWCACSLDVGESAIVDRFGQITPKVVFAVDGYAADGKMVDSQSTVQALKEQVASIEQLVLVPYVNERPATRAVHGAKLFRDFGGTGGAASFARVPFEQPAFILFSPGYGVPRCVVHSAGGALLQQLKDHVLHTDMGAGDRHLCLTTCGSALWSSLVSGLATGATIVLFDGPPLQADPRLPWRVVAAEKVTIFGASAQFLSACEQAGFRPAAELDLSALRTVVSADSSLDPPTYRYVYHDVKPDVLLASIAGGNDLLASFGSGCPILPVHEGEIQCLSLGMKTQVYDDAGEALIDKRGELVCTAPFPSMPLGFWGDTNGKRFQEAYFARFPNVWCNGDLATITSRGGLIVHGRSAELRA